LRHIRVPGAIPKVTKKLTIFRDEALFRAFLSVKRPKRPRLLRDPLSVEDTPMSDEREGRGEDNREIAERIRQLARQARIAEIQQELFELADRLDRMAEDNGTT
jgi:hypothetical protein